MSGSDEHEATPVYEGDVGALAWITAFVGCIGGIALVGGGVGWLIYWLVAGR